MSQSEASDVRVDYPVSAAIRARLMGALLLLVGALVLVVSVLVFAIDLPRDLLSAMVLLVPVLVAGGGYVVTRRTWVVRTDPVGYRVRLVRGAGVTSARWRDVKDVVTSTVHGSRCVVLRLQDGGTTTIPVAALQVDDDAFARAVRARLNRSHGYRS